MEIPKKFKDYPCSDYFDSSLALNGYWDERGQIWCILPAAEIEELIDHNGQPLNFLHVGRPGIDGISFGYRKNEMGFWAYHPIVGEFEYLADTILDFLNNWIAGQNKI